MMTVVTHNIKWKQGMWQCRIRPEGRGRGWDWLVSTYVVCERLSVMHEPAGVVENLVQILQFTPILQNRIPPPPPEIVRNLGTLTFQLQNTPPPPENCQKSWHFNFSVAEYPPPLKIVRNLGTLTFQLQNTPPPKIVRNLGTLTFQLQNTPPPPRKLSEILAL